MADKSTTSGTSMLTRLLIIGGIAVAYEVARPPDMPSLREAFEDLLQPKDDTKQTTPKQGKNTGNDSPFISLPDDFVRRQQFVQGITEDFKFFVDETFAPMCTEDTDETAVHEISDIDIEALRGIIFRPGVETIPDLNALVQDAWDVFMAEIQRNMHGTSAHGYTVPFTCTNVENDLKDWPWNSREMSFHQLRERVLMEYTVNL